MKSKISSPGTPRTAPAPVVAEALAGRHRGGVRVFLPLMVARVSHLSPSGSLFTKTHQMYLQDEETWKIVATMSCKYTRTPPRCLPASASATTGVGAVRGVPGLETFDFTSVFVRFILCAVRTI